MRQNALLCGNELNAICNNCIRENSLSSVVMVLFFLSGHSRFKSCQVPIFLLCICSFFFFVTDSIRKNIICSEGISIDNKCWANLVHGIKIAYERVENIAGDGEKILVMTDFFSHNVF